MVISSVTLFPMHRWFAKIWIKSSIKNRALENVGFGSFLRIHRGHFSNHTAYVGTFFVSELLFTAI